MLRRVLLLVPFLLCACSGDDANTTQADAADDGDYAEVWTGRPDDGPVDTGKDTGSDATSEAGDAVGDSAETAVDAPADAPGDVTDAATDVSEAG